MKIHPRFFPAIILTVFVLSVLLGVLLGFRPEHEGGGRPHSAIEWKLPEPERLGAAR